MKLTLHLRAFAIVLLCVHASQAENSILQCDRPAPQDQSGSPKFLCGVDITVVRNPDCSATITERYLFPYTTGRDAYRSIPLIEGQQIAKNVLAKRDNVTVFAANVLQSQPGINEVRVNLPTLQRRHPVLFTLQYVLGAAVTKFTTVCDGGTVVVPSDNETVNVIRWRTGSWDKIFDKMRVSFVTSNNNASFSVASAPNGQVLPSSQRNSTIIMWQDVVTEGTSVDVLVAERGTELCAQSLQCFPGNGANTVCAKSGIARSVCLLVINIWSLVGCPRAGTVVIFWGEVQPTSTPTY